MALLVLSAACSALPSCRTPPPGVVGHGAAGATTSRRSALLSAAALAATAATPQAALADGASGAWAKHSGAFDDAFFAGFTPSKADKDFLYKFLEPGEGPTAVNFQSVTMHYTGYLLDGKQFDSSYGKDPFKFRVGKGKVIRGWEGLALGMKAGSKLIAKIPAEYAYGDKGIGPIPPGATLVFYMECIKLGSIKGDKPRLPDLSEGKMST